jgi:polar amino acid transport system substrate-binding protein
MLLASSAFAQNAAPTLRVATFIVPPFVFEQNDTLAGFSIELWNAIATKLAVKTDYEIAPTAEDFLGALRSKKADLAIAEVFITLDRDQEFDFSIAVLSAGQRIMVRDTGERVEVNPLLDMFDLLFSRTTLAWFGIAVLFILLPAHIVWFVERGREGGVVPSTRYFPGIFQAMYWASTTLLTQAQQGPVQWFARLVSSLFMFIAIVFVALYTAQLTTTLTVRHIRGDINNAEDLLGKRVAALKGSISVNYLRDYGANILEFARLEEMYQALQDKKVDAVVSAGPVLLYYAAHEGLGRARVVGLEFDRQDVGFVFPVDSPLRRRVDGALLSLRQNGTYKQIYAKWFGSN